VNFCAIDPLSDHRWDDLVARHPRASAFHERGWLEALRRTYDYQPWALTSAGPGEPLADGIVFCRIASWITGTRLVSLPFSDHCDPLLSERADFTSFLRAVRTAGDERACRYVEFRPLLPISERDSWLEKSGTYCFHALNLTPSGEEIFSAFHRNSIQRKIRRAEREQLSYEAGSSAPLVAEFYRLILITRKRHRLLPQPRAWFQNLAECLGDKMQIRLARKDGNPVAAILSLRHKRSVIYKYGCSDERFHNLGGMPFLFWRLIEESKAAGAEEIDLGRSDSEHEGLTTFKDRFGAIRSELKYYRHYYNRTGQTSTVPGAGVLRRFVPMLPGRVLSGAGAVLYKHLG
jgi:CelD/BcsL family acetyltransferase involved in cellulose biosynthesis